MPTYSTLTLPTWPILRQLPADRIITRAAEAKVGDVVFVYDPNTRVYIQDGNGPTSSCIDRYHYVARAITGETRISWILNDCYKIKKNSNQIYGLDDVHDELLVTVYRAEMYHKVRFMEDREVLKNVAQIFKNSFSAKSTSNGVANLIFASKDRESLIQVARCLGYSLDGKDQK